MDSPSLLHFLKEHAIPFTHQEHAAVFTSEQARLLVPALPGFSAKNLFLRNKKGNRYFLLALADAKTPNLKALAVTLGTSNLSLASPQRLKEVLGITPGAVSLLALVNDSSHLVEVLVDQDLWKADAVQCHPLVNTATLVISIAGLNQFLKLTGHTPRLIAILP
jgi:Ala-tRNA(Pro) deacylase